MAHEDLEREREVEGSSDRSFGVVFAIVFVVPASCGRSHRGVRFHSFCQRINSGLLTWAQESMRQSAHRTPTASPFLPFRHDRGLPPALASGVSSANGYWPQEG